MSDSVKTLIYIGAAVVLGLLAFFARPRPEALDVESQTGKLLFEDFQDPTKVQSLEIVRFDEDLGEIHTFEVTKNKKTGLWTIPSHSDYPADAEDRVRDAATFFVGLKILDNATDEDEGATNHKYYGVVEPDKDTLKLGDEGVGLLVNFENDKGDDYALVVGEKVKGSEDLRFVRKPGQDIVYVAKIDPEKLSTQFEDWIEKDFLNLSPWDVENLRIRDYSLVQAVQGTFLEPRFDMAVTYNSTDSKWELDEFITYRGKEEAPTELLPTEELNKEKLDDLKEALDDLEIVDVRRKPKGMGADLKAGKEFMNNRDARDSLRTRGFFPNPVGDGEYDLLAANGEVHVGMKDGVEYVLRFGNVAGTDDSSEEAKLNRYLLVTARVDDAKLPRPEMEPLPEGAVKTTEAPATASQEKPAPPAKPDPAGPGVEKPAGESSSDSPAGAAAEPSTFTPLQEEKPAPAEKPAAQPAEEKPAEKAPEKPAPEKPEAKPADSTPAEEKPAPAEKPEAKPAAKQEDAEMEADKPETTAAENQPDETAEMATPPEDQTELDKEIERINKENQRKLDEWNEKKKEAENKVRELNARFADWYYVISEDVYKKIHLNRTDLIKITEEAKEEGFGLDALRKLEEEGVEGGDSDEDESNE
jgi:hypothetical protein